MKKDDQEFIKAVRRYTHRSITVRRLLMSSSYLEINVVKVKARPKKRNMLIAHTTNQIILMKQNAERKVLLKLIFKWE